MVSTATFPFHWTSNEHETEVIPHDPNQFFFFYPFLKKTKQNKSIPPTSSINGEERGGWGRLAPLQRPGSLADDQSLPVVARPTLAAVGSTRLKITRLAAPAPTGYKSREVDYNLSRPCASATCNVCRDGGEPNANCRLLTLGPKIWQS